MVYRIISFRFLVQSPSHKREFLMLLRRFYRPQGHMVIFEIEAAEIRSYVLNHVKQANSIAVLFQLTVSRDP